MNASHSDRPLRVVHVVESAATGVGRHVLDIAAGAIGAGHQTDVIYSPLREDAIFRAGRAALTKVRFDPVPMQRNPGPWDLSAVAAVRRLVASGGPYDVIHGHSSKGGMLARLAGISSGAAVVYTPHAISTQDPALGGLKRAVFHVGETLLARLTDRIIAVSTAECDHIVGLGVPRSKLAVIPNGVARPSGPTRDAARAMLKLPDGCFVAGFVGRLGWQKAIDVMIAAFAPVAKADPQARLVVIGEGPDGDAARGTAEMLGCAGQVMWLGAVDARKHYPAFDLFAQPSRYEGFSYAVLEAASHGVAVLTTDVGGSRETVVEGVSGMIVPPNDPGAFSAAFMALASDRQRLADMGKAAGRQMASVDGRQQMIDATLTLYAGLAASTRPAGRSGPPEVQK